MNNKYTVSVLFVNYEDFWSKVVYYVLGRGYSHAAISVDNEGETFYSFNFKGFRRETKKACGHCVQEYMLQVKCDKKRI